MTATLLTMIALAGLTPAEAVRASLADLETLPAARHGQIRYLVLTGTDEKARDTQARAASFLLNSVSRVRVLSVPERVADGRMLRVDLAAFHDFRKPEQFTELFQAWEKVAETDPYWHIRTEVLTPAAAARTAKSRAPSGPASAAGKGTSIVTTDGGWVDLEAAAKLKSVTGSFGAVLRVDYFAARVGGESYYDWAGIPETESDFLKSFGVDPTRVGELSADTAANILRSAVTRKPRRVIFRPGAFGAVITTKDIAAETPDRDPFRSPVDFADQKFRFDASEIFALGSNGLWRTAIFDAAGKRTDTVPPEVAHDFAGDGQIRSHVSCLRCHELNGGEAGLQPFRDDMHDLLIGASAGSYIPEVTQRIAELYDPGTLGRGMARAREDYQAAVAACTGGLSTKDATIAVADLYSGYLDKQITTAVAAEELGIYPKDFAEAMAGTNDPIVLMLRLGKPVNRAAWEASYHVAALAAANWSHSHER